MQLLTSWKDSLLFFKPENAKLLCLVILNACRHTLGLYIYFWWLFIPTIFSVIYTRNTYWSLPAVVPLFLLVFVMYLAVRPSTLRKDYSYFLSYGKHFFWFFLFFLVWLIFFCSLFLAGLPCWFFAFPLYAPLFPFFSTMTFFLLDSDGSCRSALASIYRSFLFVLYNLPLCFFVACLFLCLAHYVYMLCSWATIGIILLWPLPIATYNTLYVKRVHEQFQLYFGVYHAE